jgi:hypothetical protein
MSLPEKNQFQNHKLRRNIGIVLSTTGLLIFIFGAKPEWFGMNRSVAIGFIQIGVFSFGLLVLCLGTTITLNSLWPDDRRTIAADVGHRLAWTGYLLAFFSGMADTIGLGTRPFPYFSPFFGYLQARGFLAGQVVMLVGLLMMIPFRLPPEPINENPNIDLTEN